MQQLLKRLEEMKDNAHKRSIKANDNYLLAVMDSRGQIDSREQVDCEIEYFACKAEETTAERIIEIVKNTDESVKKVFQNKINSLFEDNKKAHQDYRDGKLTSKEYDALNKIYTSQIAILYELAHDLDNR